MNATTFLKKNIVWNCAKNLHDNLVCTPTTKQQLCDQLQRLSEKYYPQRQKVQTLYAEFSLNEIALARPKNRVQMHAKQLFFAQWADFLQLKGKFGMPEATFPSDGVQTRLEAIATLVTQCTQNCATAAEKEEVCQVVREKFDLEDCESNCLEDVLHLFEIKFYCAICRNVFCGKSIEKFAKAYCKKPLKLPLAPNESLKHAYYCDGKLCANVDCLGNSATHFRTQTHVEVNTKIFRMGRNVFDTFCFSNLGQKTAQFCSESKTLKVEMQYFLQNDTEVRKYVLTNTGNSKQNLTADFFLLHRNPSAKTTYFQHEGALCLAVEQTEQFCCALAAICDGKLFESPFEEGRISAKFSVPSGQSVCFDLVTVYTENVQTLFDKIERLANFGETRCPYPFDSVANCVQLKTPLCPTMCGNALRLLPPKAASKLDFSYQLGDDAVATFLDNAGNETTLLNGFCFGTGGAKVFSIKNGIARQLNCGKFSLSTSVLYQKDGTVCEISHNGEKTYDVKHANPTRTLFVLPLEEKSEITFCDGVFCVKSALRNFEVCCDNVESFTTNALECNTERIRYKLSGELGCGTCLAVCSKPSLGAKLAIRRTDIPPQRTPLIRESLVSTYLNYVNDKNTFCLSNFLKRADCLTLAAIVYTNPNFVKKFILSAEGGFFYDGCGQRKNFRDKLAVPLAAVYYATVTGDKTLLQHTKDVICDVLFAQCFYGKDLCIRALILKKAAQLKIFDKVRCLIEYNQAKKAICSDAALFGYAQAIGAVPMNNPSKQRLKDLCSTYGIAKSWYYVSQLENIYGLSICDGALKFAPKISQDNVLERLAVTVDDKRIDVTFLKSTVQSMTLNGTQYFAAFKPQSLKKQNNKLVVRY